MIIDAAGLTFNLGTHMYNPVTIYLTTSLTSVISAESSWIIIFERWILSGKRRQVPQLGSFHGLTDAVIWHVIWDVILRIITKDIRMNWRHPKILSYAVIIFSGERHVEILSQILPSVPVHHSPIFFMLWSFLWFLYIGIEYDTSLAIIWVTKISSNYMI